MVRLRLPGPWRRRLDRWIARRTGPPRGQTRLDHRRIYILPSGAAAALALLLAGLLLLAINYRNALVYLLAFWLAAAAVVAILHTFRNLAGLRLRPGPVAPVFAGDTARFRVMLENPDPRPRLAVTVGERERRAPRWMCPVEIRRSGCWRCPPRSAAGWTPARSA